MALIQAPSNARMTRIINFSTTVIANATGAASTLIDPSLALTGSSDWASVTALFTRARVHRCIMKVYPDQFYTTAAPTAYFGSCVTYYDPAAAAAVSTIAAGMDFAVHAIVHSSKVVTLDVRLINKLGVTTPIVVSEFVANFLGQIVFVGPNGSYANNASIALITITFICEFSYQK